MAKNKQRQQSIEDELASIHASAGKRMESSDCQSAYQLFGELRSRARAEGQLGYFVIGTFFQMNLAQRLLDFENTRERAIELIAIFEDEEQARRIEPQLDLDQYESVIYSMGACAYEVLAEATGELNGFNSEGMQECLTGGIEICHRIGKLNCVQCFREYACDIHAAADDYELARFHCNQLLGHHDQFADRGDRRWNAMLQLAILDLLDGQQESARSKLNAAMELAGQESVHDRSSAQSAVAFELRTLDLLENVSIEGSLQVLRQALPLRGECPQFDLELDHLLSLEHSMQGDWQSAEDLLIPWVRKLKMNKATTKWLETGVRLVAIQRLKGDLVQAKRLSNQFEEAATRANDWQSIRRLHFCLDDSRAITPLGTVVRNTRAASSIPHSEPSLLQPLEDVHEVQSDDETNPNPQSQLEEITPLKVFLDSLQEQMLAAAKQSETEGPTDEEVATLRTQLLELQPEKLSHPHDIGRVLNLMTLLVSPEADRETIWKWANRIVSRHQDVAYLLSLLGRLGMAISLIDRLTHEMQRSDPFHWGEELGNGGIENSDPSLFSSKSEITNDRLEQLMRKALEMDSNGVKNHFRAAEVFEYIGKEGEAERCYARAFRLDRSHSDAALALARIYAESERLQDALYVLDLCIRSGGSSQELLFEAALKAHSLTQYELQLSYLNKLHDQFGAAPGTHYYQSLGFLELKRSDEALQSLRKEVKEFKSKGLHIDSVRALAMAQRGDQVEATKAIKKSLDYSLPTIDYIAPSGISGAFERLVAAAKLCDGQIELQRNVENRMLVAGIATESYFEHFRSNEKPRDLFLFQCYVAQELDDTWPEDEGCFYDQTDWDIEYFALWGVLAEDASQAADIALTWQQKCFHLPSTVHSVEKADQLLHDRPGIAFQGPRYDSLDFDPDDFDDDDEDFDDE